MAAEPVARMIHQHPLAYLLGLEGVALMRAFAGEYDESFAAARIAEVRSLLDRADAFGPGTTLPEITSTEGYAGWAQTYDGEENGCFPLRDGVLQPMLDRLPPGRVLDAACGTGAVAAQLVARGHDVVGVDLSQEMLAHAVKAVPGASFLVGDLHALPFADGDVDHVVCSLALTHVPELEPFFAEAARVMRAGGHLLVLDTRGHFIGSSRYPIVRRAPDGRVGYVAGYTHTTGDYVRASLRQGFVARACEEPDRGLLVVGPDDEPAPITPGPPDVWDLHPWVRDAANAAKAGHPAVIAWDFELRTDV